MLVSILIPVYNEEKTIVELLDKVLRVKFPRGFTRELVVIDDASTDKTPKLLKKFTRFLSIIRHDKNLGKGAAIKSGLAACSGDLVLIQDADLEYNPSDYINLLKPFSDPKVKVVYGSRLINYPLRLMGANKTPMPIHLLANKFLTFLTNILYNSSITDMETCYKVLNKKLLTSLNLVSERFDIEPEITAKILKQNIPILEVPIQVSPRTYSEGKKIGWKDGFKAIWTLIKYRLLA